MSDLIDRQAAIDTIDDLIEARYNWREPYMEEIKGLNAAMCAIIDLPSAQPECKTGQWIVFPSPDDYHCGLVKCPFCNEELIASPGEYHFCPNCGAKMEEGDGN